MKNWGMMKHRVARFVVAAAVGGSVFQLSGCDPRVRDTILVGLEETTQGISSVLISAFFITLDDENDPSGGGTTGGTTTTSP